MMNEERGGKRGETVGDRDRDDEMKEGREMMREEGERDDDERRGGRERQRQRQR